MEGKDPLRSGLDRPPSAPAGKDYPGRRPGSTDPKDFPVPLLPLFPYPCNTDRVRVHTSCPDPGGGLVRSWGGGRWVTETTDVLRPREVPTPTHLDRRSYQPSLEVPVFSTILTVTLGSVRGRGETRSQRGNVVLGTLPARTSVRTSRPWQTGGAQFGGTTVNSLVFVQGTIY